MYQAEIIVDNITKQFDNEILFKELSITFTQGMSYAIQGVSGSGKSTLLSLLADLDKPTIGCVKFRYKKEAEVVFSNIYRDSIGLLFQQPYLIKELSVLENIQLPGHIRGIDTKLCAQRARSLLEKIGLTHKAHAYPGQLSGGQLQRVALARALFNQPLFLIADEPTASLDPQASLEIMKLLIKVQKEFSMGLIVATHDKELAQLLDERYVMQGQALSKQQ